MTLLDLLDARGQPVSLRDGRWVIEEARRYQLIGPVKEAWLGARPLPSTARGLFELVTDHVVGHTHVTVRDVHGQRRSVPVHIEPRADKLSPDLWLAMVAELEGFLEGVTVGGAGARHGAVGLEGAALPLLAESLLPLVPSLLAAFADVLAELRLRERTRVTPRPLPSARRVDAESLRWLVRHPEVAAWTSPWHEPVGEPPWIPLRTAHDTLDHPANRYVAWLIDRVSRTLGAVADQLSRQARHPQAGEAGPWCEVRARRLEHAAQQLGSALRASPLATLPRAPASEAALLVVLDDPRYARMHRIGRRFLAPRFRLRATELPAPVAPSYTVYELWTLLAMATRLQQALPAWSWSWRHLEALVSTATGSGAHLQGRGPRGEQLGLWFNRRFVSSLQRTTQSSWSVSKERRPDLCVTYRDARTQRWLALDAKYRTGATNLGDAFASAHVYRDALRWEGLGGPPLAALLLAPAPTPEASLWFSEPFLRDHGCGVWVLRPGLPPTGTLVRWILGTLAPHLEVPEP